MQIWDFHLGQLRTHEESDHLEVAYGSSDAGFVIKNIGELMKETSFSNAKMFVDMYQLDCPIAHDDMALFNVIPFSTIKLCEILRLGSSYNLCGILYYFC